MKHAIAPIFQLAVEWNCGFVKIVHNGNNRFFHSRSSLEVELGLRGTNIGQRTGVVTEGVRLVGVSQASLLIDLDAQTRLIGDVDIAILIAQLLVGHVCTPGHIGVHDLQNGEVGAAACQLQCCGIGNRAGGIVGRKGDIAGLRLSSDLLQESNERNKAITDGKDTCYNRDIQRNGVDGKVP